jgi:DNA-binding CsgD family transcriptional regulator
VGLTSETSAAIGAIYDTVLDPEAWPRAMSAVRNIVGGAGSALFAFDHDSATIPFCVFENLGPDRDHEYVRRLHCINPRAAKTMAEPPGVPCWDYRVISEREMDRHEFYDGIHRLSGVRYFVGMRPLLVDGRSLLTSVERTRKQGHFDESEIALFSRIAPHIGHAFRLAGANAQSQADAALLHLVDQVRPEAVLLLDAAGGLMEANSEARRVLALGDGLKLIDGCLQPWKAADRRALNRLISGALATTTGQAPGGGGVMALPRPSGALPFLLRVMPWPRGNADPFRRPAAVVLLRDPERTAAVGAAELADLLGLTAREAALARRLARGDSLQDCAAALGISRNTARVHLRNIFEKTGISSQRQLLRLMLAVP